MAPPSNDPADNEIIRAWASRRRTQARLRPVAVSVILASFGLCAYFDLLERPLIVVGVLLPMALAYAVIEARYTRCPRCHKDPRPRIRFDAPKHVQRGANDLERCETCAQCGATLLDDATIAEFRARRFPTG